MAIRPPSKDELAAIARHYGMNLTEKDLGSFEPLVAGLLSSYEAVEDLYAASAPPPPAGRSWTQPEPAQNPLGQHRPRARPRSEARPERSAATAAAASAPPRPRAAAGPKIREQPAAIERPTGP